MPGCIAALVEEVLFVEGVFGDGDDCRVGEAIDDVHVCPDVAGVATPTAFRTLCGLCVDPPDVLSAMGC